ncbi:hypothetical protein E1A91_D01G190200v1 [Gossypium mustelinum]|uniref:Uncharacterized protein n=1 Tax=Gossypium mustelinum TaxID=34275 RepID=A0A5D2W8X6_GOSMU|nr:hypothetical protein E1A91_D01G190200v1 [Gossypium mustelinum]
MVLKLQALHQVLKDISLLRVILQCLVILRLQVLKMKVLPWVPMLQRLMVLRLLFLRALPQVLTDLSLLQVTLQALVLQ